MNFKIFVKNLPDSLTGKESVELFSACGNIALNRAEFATMISPEVGLAAHSRSRCRAHCPN